MRVEERVKPAEFFKPEVASLNMGSINFALFPTLNRYKTSLKLCIKDDIYAQSAISRRRIKSALRSYCNSVHYLRASTEGAVRIDLTGEPAGTVTATRRRRTKKETEGTTRT
jgi:sRNA-binding protein